MKKFSFLAVMALLMMFGCSKDEVTTDEQEPFSTEENNQLNNEEDGCYCIDSVTVIRFFSNSIDDKVFVNGCLPSARKLLNKGMFNGEILGYGLIDSSISTYEIISCEEAPTDSSGEPLMYKLIAEGELSLSTLDKCSITITGNLYPFYNVVTKVNRDLFRGKATTHDGVGKLEDFNKTFEVYNSWSGNYYTGINLVTGKIDLMLNDFNQN